MRVKHAKDLTCTCLHMSNEGISVIRSVNDFFYLHIVHYTFFFNANKKICIYNYIFCHNPNFIEEKITET